jgi:arsenate reductase
MSQTRVLFLSTGNAARGIMAEAILRHKGGDRFIAQSAGYDMLPAIDPQILALLKEDGVSTDGLHSKGWSEFFQSPSSLLVDVIVTLSEEARSNCPQWPGDPVRVHWPVDDVMAAKDLDQREWKMRKCYGVLQTRIDTLIKHRKAQSPVELMFQLRSIASVV